MGKDVVVQRFRAELHATRDELGCGIGSERVGECITAGLPLVTTSEAKLYIVSKNRRGDVKLTHMSAWTPRPLFHAALTMSSLHVHILKRRITYISNVYPLETIIVAGAVETDITTVEVVSDVSKFRIQLAWALA